MSEQRLLDDLRGRMPQQGPGWLHGLRGSAAAALASGGLPTSRDEAWRFTSLRGIVDRSFEHGSGGAARPAPAEVLPWLDAELGADETARIHVLGGQVILDGRTAMPEGLADGVQAVALSRASGALADVAASALGHIARVEHFAALNAALFEDALIVHVTGDGAGAAGPARPLHIVCAGVPGATATAAYPRVLVVLAPGARLTLVETLVVQPGAPQLVNAVTEIALGAGASLEHVRVHRGAPSVHDAYQVAHVAVRQAQGSSYASRVITLGGALTRLDLDVELTAPDARCQLDGVYHAGRGEHVDHYTRIAHQAPSCTSNERYRGIVDGTGHAVFDGTVVVARDAQHTDAHQENRNLLLSDDAVVNTRPHLRIDADDVKCSHGATVGSLDPAQLFYLRARGVSEEQARALLTYAFVRELIDEVPHAPLARLLATAIRGRLPHGQSLAESLPESSEEQIP
ncbi:MAG TPA: Fe-S cluster assembly protein SufD [Haliangium sp.]|nr:Fe-S cluster assembly protein SufD [Haliangium sp.]